MSKVPTKLQISAGGVAFRKRAEKIEVALISVGDDNRWQLPKGLVDKGESTEMGNKHAIPYGLYLGYGHFSAPLARRTGVSAADLEMLWRAFTLMFEHDRAAGRGEITLRGLYVFTHQDAFGSTPAQALFDRITATPVPKDGPPRSFADYQVQINADDLPDGVTLTRITG